MVILITSYNNAQWVEKNLNSVYIQKYKNYRVIYVDDCSTDDTYERVVKSVHAHKQKRRFTIIRNSERRNAMANFYTSIHMCKDYEIVVTLDGDDWFVHDHVLSYVNTVYSNPDIWLTYGRYQYLSKPKAPDHNADFPQEVLEHNKFRGQSDFPVSHLRTHYAWLFKLIKLQDFLYEDYFVAMTSDYAMFLPMIEMASWGHFLRLQQVLYVYNDHNPINDRKVNQQMQILLGDYILHKQSYSPLREPIAMDTVEQHDHMSVVFVGDSGPGQACVDAIRKQVPDMQALYVVAPHVSVTLMTSLMACLATCESNYVLLCTGDYECTQKFDWPTCRALLKKTQTDVFYCALGYDAHMQQLFNRGRLPLVSQEFPVYAWYANNRKGNWQAPVLNMTIFKKQALINLLAGIDAKTVDELQFLLDMRMQQVPTLGLMFNHTIMQESM